MKWIGQGALRGAACSLAVVVLAACGGGGGASSEGGSGGAGTVIPTSTYMPLSIGNRWTYKINGDGVTYLAKVTSTRTINGQTALVVRTDEPGVAESVYVQDSGGLQRWPGVDADVLTQTVGPVVLLPTSIALGGTFVAINKDLGRVLDFDGDGIGDPTSLRATTEVVERTTLDTPLGRLDNCLHLRTRSTLTISLSQLRRTGTVVDVTDDWYAPDVGPVQSRTSTQVDNQPADTFEQTTVGYAIAGRRSDTVTPHGSVTGGNSPRGPLSTFELNFDKDMDTEGLAQALDIADSSSAPIPGTTTATRRSLRFVPSSPWREGTYTARLTSRAVDLLGNTVTEPRAWSLSIDSTAPVLTQSTPASGAIDVDVGQNVVLTFNEAVDPASVDWLTVYVSYGTATYEVSGNTVTVRPTAPMERGQRYTVTVNGVKDLAGNAMAVSFVRFTTDPGRFGFPFALNTAPEGGVYSGMIGTVADLTGDGRLDIINKVTVWTGTGWLDHLQLFAQQPNGSLSAPVDLPLRTDCSLLAVRAADMNGDGRPDLVVASPCGIEIYLQGADGSFSASGPFGPGVVGLEVADLNGDGRSDLVAFHSSLTLPDTISVWINDPTGWAGPQSYQVEAQAQVQRIAVGDLNGDGKPDIAFSATRAGAYSPAGVMIQRGDATFAVRWQPTSNDGIAGSLAIGDVNGDGRADLVVAMTSGIGVYPQAMDGSLQPLQWIDPQQFFAEAIHLADLNGDGRLDLIYSMISSNLVVRLQQVDGSLAPAATYNDTFRGSNGNPEMLNIGDVNGDGRPDVVLYGNVFLQRPVAVMAQSVSRRQASMRATSSPRLSTGRLPSLEGLRSTWQKSTPANAR